MCRDEWAISWIVKSERKKKLKSWKKKWPFKFRVNKQIIIKGKTERKDLLLINYFVSTENNNACKLISIKIFFILFFDSFFTFHSSKSKNSPQFQKRLKKSTYIVTCIIFKTIFLKIFPTYHEIPCTFICV